MQLVTPELKTVLLNLVKPDCNFETTEVFEGSEDHGLYHFYFENKTSFSYSKEDIKKLSEKEEIK